LIFYNNSIRQRLSSNEKRNKNQEEKESYHKSFRDREYIYINHLPLIKFPVDARMTNITDDAKR